MVSLYNFVMPHKSLGQGGTSRTPAMAIGLTDHVWSYREYIWLPVHADPALHQQFKDRMRHLLTPALQAQPSSRKQVKVPTREINKVQGEEENTKPKAA
jgi:hypothetical protein